jgi:hypothetical protein
MSSFVINSTHAIVCGGFVSGAAYPLEFINECYIFSHSQGKFVSRFVDSRLGRTAAPMWSVANTTMVLWSGAGDNGVKYTNYLKFNTSSTFKPQYPLSLSLSLLTFASSSSPRFDPLLPSF